jgi:hypothetical protein
MDILETPFNKTTPTITYVYLYYNITFTDYILYRQPLYPDNT